VNKQTVFLENKHVGITGANGFLGSHICKVLREKGATIHAFVYPGTPTKSISAYVSGSGGTFVPMDITMPETMEGKFDGIEYLFHVAGTVAEWAHPVAKAFDINFRGAWNVHHHAKEAGVKRTVHTSTMSANGSCPDPYPSMTSEDAPFDLQGAGVYAVSKHLGDRVAKDSNVPGVYETVRIRPHQILGWGDTGPSVPGQLVLRAITGGFPGYIDQDTQIVHVEDVASAQVSAMERGTPGSVYNIASARPVAAYSFLRYACKVAKAKPPAPVAIPKGLIRIAASVLEAVSNHVTHKPPLVTVGNARILYKNMGTSIERAKTELGFDPRPWQEAVKEAVRWFQEGYRPVEQGH
jgi:dihydroflavonol-4-reductase